MRLQLLNKQIIDEREEGLANKAGAETAGFLFLALTVFSVGSIFTSKVGLSPIMVVALLIVSGLYYSVRCQRLGVKFISYSYLNATGIVAVTFILSLFIWAQNFQLNQAVYQSNPFHYGCDWKARSNELYLESKVSGQNSIRNSRLCHPDRSA